MPLPLKHLLYKSVTEMCKGKDSMLLQLPKVKRRFSVCDDTLGNGNIQYIHLIPAPVDRTSVNAWL